MDPAEVLVVTVATPDDEVAGRLATELVQRRLAACAQVGGPITSVYRWQGALERAEEWMLTAKTTAGCLDRLVAAVGELHPYDVPEVVAVPAAGGDERYLDWVRAETD